MPRPYLRGRRDILAFFNRKKNTQFEEIEEYRALLEPPKVYEEAFNLKTIIGAIFVSVIMVPGNIYLHLMIGGGIGAAAEWVTIILFLELSKRSFTTLKRQEIYLLFYVTTALIGAETGAFEGLLWWQYFVQSPAAQQFGITKFIPSWVAPQPGSEALLNRTFLHPDWFAPIALLVIGMVMGKISWFTGGYVLFRLTSDYERLPFPFAPINAQGAMALAEESEGGTGWRWRMFSVGGVIGIVWGIVYVAVPAITGTIMSEPLQIIPIPYVDFTQYTGYFLPATPLGFTCHLGPIFVGLVAPFWGIIGTFFGVMVYTVANPILYKYGMLPHWFLGMDTIQTSFVNGVDFWMSFGFGTTLAVTLIGFYQMFAGVRSARQKEAGAPVRSFRPPAGRGDFRILPCLILFAITGIYTIGLAKYLFPGLVTNRLILFFILFAFVYTPIISFVNARLIGLVGQSVNIPYIREATIFLSGFRGVEVWFIPFPLAVHGGQAQKFREIELTGTRFTSILKAEVFMVPLVLVTSFFYWSYIWKLAPIPSESYPYAQVFWPLRALQSCVWFTSTLKSEMTVRPDQVTWSPSNLTDGSWWYWRVRATADVDQKDPKARRYGPWSKVGAFYTDFDGKGLPAYKPAVPDQGETGPSPGRTPEGRALSAPHLLSFASGERADTPTPNLVVSSVVGPDGKRVEYYFEIDQAPTFDGSFLQTSADRPIFYEAIKPTVIVTGFVFSLLLFSGLSVLGLPILFVFGFIRSVGALPHFVITEIIGALLARFYFMKKYGRQQWRLYATVLAVGFSVGMALVGMASVSIAMIQKSVSVLLF
ncbi:MAG: hypothetical protein A3F84_27635 [Candidatus Handelsmanbacteria bacterium RIFCSPLOWO2_12_FULL_64_10]|uniref:Peptide transporter n=1 Tax=Handelsmanbacteria sp. (strain RIFCSPLOWO2_12_FULL_64_10) TaxID=1817868 RepID=A0A1F6CZY1_HANXR|nr:MAG: hypothetical protein A3F84_27635 [Candidatus Handelsmanbacteria bacterium RIFCSPLOWO2_12_FULL_64_10]